MQEKTISVIALSNRDFPSFESRLAEAVQWLEVAAAHGADLAVLPEALNLYRGDGVGNPLALTFQQAALDDWEGATALLRAAAVKYRLAVTVPVITREGGHLTNSFFLIDQSGRTIGRFQKLFPTPAELAEEVQPGRVQLLDWEGLKIGGAICFDTCFEATFAEQAAAGAQLFLVPSLWPGGSQLNYFALKYSTPIAVAYPAWSRLIDLDGTETAAGGYRHETLRFGFGIPVYTATVNFDRVALYGNHNQEKMLAVQRAYGARVRIRFDQANCLFFLESRSPDLTVREVLQEFDLVSARDYFAQTNAAVRRLTLCD